MRLAIRLGTLLAVLFALGALHAAPVPKDTRPPAQIELGRLDGTWQVTSYQIAGREVLRNGNTMIIAFKNGTFAWAKGSSGNGKIARIDPTRSPKEVDYTFADGADAGTTIRAIYKLDGDTFTDCFDMRTGDRPTAFESTQENGLYLMTYKRVKQDN